MNLNKRENLILILAVACISILLADRFIISPMIETYSRRTADIQKLKDDLAKGHYLIKREKQISEDLNKMVTTSLPDDATSVEKLMSEAVLRWQNASTVNLTVFFNPRWEKDVGGDIPILAKIDKLELKVSATGNIQSITRFLYEMENDPLALRVEDVEINSRDAKAQTLNLEARVTGLVISKEGGSR